MGPNVVVVGWGIDIRQVWFLPVRSLESSWKTGLPGTEEIGATTLGPQRNPEKPEVNGLSEH